MLLLWMGAMPHAAAMLACSSATELPGRDREAEFKVVMETPEEGAPNIHLQLASIWGNNCVPFISY